MRLPYADVIRNYSDMYEMLLRPNGSPKSMGEIWIDRDNGLVKKYFKPDSITIQGKTPWTSDIDEIRKCFEREIYWTNRLRSDLLLETYEHGDLPDGTGYYLIQEYGGPDLSYSYDPEHRLSHIIPDITHQIVEMFKLFKHHNMHKTNNAMSNLVAVNGRLKVFDFKYAQRRTAMSRMREFRSINEWLSKIDTNLPYLLEEYI